MLRPVFGINETTLADSDSPETIPSWDSLNQIHLVMELEAEFNIEFDPDEIGELISVGAIRCRIEAARCGR